MDQEEDQPEQEEEKETQIEVEMPKITQDLGNQMHFVKMPNFLSIEVRYRAKVNLM